LIVDYLSEFLNLKLTPIMTILFSLIYNFEIDTVLFILFESISYFEIDSNFNILLNDVLSVDSKRVLL
jgi:hypothetical protein